MAGTARGSLFWGKNMNEMEYGLERVLHDEIPLTKDMGIEVVRYDGQALTLKAPIAPNMNHKSTVFGGSLYSVAVLSGWGLLHLKLKEQGLAGHIVIYESAISYHVPVDGDFEAQCGLPEELIFSRFLEGFRKKGKSRISLRANVKSKSSVAVNFEGIYVVHA